MKSRRSRPMVESRRSRHLMFRSPSTGALRTSQTATADAMPVHDPPLAPHDQAVFLLNIAAEVEHALMVQYLFAAYSLRDPSQFTPKKASLVHAWRGAIATVAREEMGHLVTVQNLLRSLGAPLSLARDATAWVGTGDLCGGDRRIRKSAANFEKPCE
jgi:ferritin-like protein